MSTSKKSNKTSKSAGKSSLRVKDLGARQDPRGGRKPGKAALAKAYGSSPGIQY